MPALAFLLGVLAATLTIAAATPGHCTRRVVVVVANRLTLRDIVDLHPPALAGLAADGAIGLVSPDCLGRKTEQSVTLSAASGVRMAAGDYLGQVFASEELVPGDTTAAASYEIRTGMKAPRGSLVFVELAAARRDNYVQPAFGTGALADAVHQAGLTTCGIGNADTSAASDRSALALAIDSTGRADVGVTRVPVSYGPSGPRSNPDALAGIVLHKARHADLTVVCFPDLVWLDFQPQASVSSGRAEAVGRLDRLVSRLRAGMGRDMALIVVSFGPPLGPPWRELTPIVIYPAPGLQGVLTSPSTRTPGVMAATDFAPTVLDTMGVRNVRAMVGRPASTLPEADPAALLTGINTRAGDNRRLMVPLGLSFAALGAISFTVAGVGAAFTLRLKPWVAEAASTGILVLATGPAALLIAGLAPPGMTSYTAAYALAAAVLTATALWVRSVARKCRSRCVSSPLLFVYVLNAALILADGFAGGSLCKWAMPSSYQLSGLRFYGIGNEFAGFVIGTSGASFAMLAACGVDRMRACRWLSVAAGIATMIVLGTSRFGANYGAVIASAVTYWLLWRALFGGRIRVWDVAGACAFALAVGAAFAAADSRLFGDTGSHAAQAARISHVVGKGYILELVSRKIAMNLRLLASPQFALAFLAFVPFLVLWFARLRPKACVAYGGRPESAHSYRAVVIGAAAAFAFNDSGAVMATIILTTVFAPILYAISESGQLESVG